METYRYDKSEKFKEIKNQFGYLTNNSIKNQIKRNYSYSNFHKRPKLPKTKNKSIEKTDLGNILDQIGNDDLIFNNDKLITSIKIESFEDAPKKNSIVSAENDKSFLSKNTNKTNATSINRRKNNRQKKNLSQNKNKINDSSFSNNLNNSLELNCNKFTYSNTNKKKPNHNKNGKKNKSQAKNKNVCKNVNQFINKPNETRKSNNQNILMTPLCNKTSLKNKNSFNNHSFQRSFLNFNNNDSISLASTSRMDMSVRGRSMPSMKTNKSMSNLRMPNKSIIKNQEKLIIELEKLFGERIQLTEDIYQNMTDLDKKNCINFLLETIKELNNSNKINKSKTDGYKQIIEAKDQDIKNYKNEIKELKKDNIKLNKLIKTNNQLNKKLSQNISNLKLQLEKEKEKNKSLQTRGKSSSKVNKIFSRKFLKENSINKNKRNKETRSQEKVKKASNFINIIKRENSNDIKINNMNNPDIDKKNNNDKEHINLIWQNNQEKTDNYQNPLVANELKDKNEINLNNENLVNE